MDATGHSDSARKKSLDQWVRKTYLFEPSWPAAGIEHCYRVEVVPSRFYFAVLDRDDRYEAIVILAPRLHPLAVNLIPEHHDRCCGISIDTEFIGAPHGHKAVVVAVRVDDLRSPLDPFRIAGT